MFINLIPQNQIYFLLYPNFNLIEDKIKLTYKNFMKILHKINGKKLKLISLKKFLLNFRRFLQEFFLK
jgi:hypothetical protein